VSGLAGGQAQGLKVTEVKLNSPQLKSMTGEFEGVFKSHVQAKLDACATGQRPVRLEAFVSRLDKANPVITTVIGGANVIRGTARLVDVGSGKELATYKIGATIVGGRVGVIKMAQAEEQLSDAYGDELCKKAFPTAGK
jgi:hypothetical protein